ncbi:hypothetical protein, partial [Francisella orientalis]|uniref:hypothetical protein n=1 Tax=Francisella orientalis TaxID=299583 RepID=UPI003BAA67E5
RRLDQLPYVAGADMELVPVEDSDDLVDVNYNIKERNANSISGSLGFSDLYGFIRALVKAFQLISIDQ